MEQQHEQLLYWLALWRTPEIGPARFSAIYKQFPQLDDFFALSTHDMTALGLKNQTIHFLKHKALEASMRDLDWHNGQDKQIIGLNSKSYPQLLKEISSAPPVLFVQGDMQCLHELQLGMVGSRNPSKGGIETATKFAHELVAHGFVITSGLAIGIDGASHEGALKANGKTIAVMGAGLDTIYPKRHQQLAQRIAASGALVSEFPLGVLPRAENFPRRNRIISGLSRGVLVVEAALKSGSLMTARYATEQGREVFAVPGSIHQVLNKGCHQLIRQGAKLVENIEDILTEFSMLNNLRETQLLDNQYKKNNSDGLKGKAMTFQKERNISLTPPTPG